MPRVLRHLYLLLAALVSFLIFDAASLPEAGRAIAGLFGGAPFTSAAGLYSLKSYFVILLLAALGRNAAPQGGCGAHFRHTRRREARFHPDPAFYGGAATRLHRLFGGRFLQPIPVFPFLRGLHA